MSEIDVIFITTSFGKKFVCLTAAEVGTFLKNYKEKYKRLDVELSHAKISENEYIVAAQESAKYFDKGN